MKIKNVLEKANNILQRNNIENYFFESREILAFILHKTKEWIMINLELEISDNEICEFEAAIEKRALGYPFQYILGYQYFMGNKFLVNEDVLIPQPDTENLVYKSIELISKINKPKILDMCTGSGCIAISLAKILPNALVFASDVSKNALDIAKINCIKNDTNVKFYLSDLFNEINENEFDIIISNPPYISIEEKDLLPSDVLKEPHIALFAEENGLMFYKKIAKEAINYLKPYGYIAFEIGRTQGIDVFNILKSFNYTNINIVKDYSNNDRVIFAQKNI